MKRLLTTVLLLLAMVVPQQVEAKDFSNETLNYEMVCIVGKRVPRIFLKNGKTVGSLNYICPTD